MKRKAVWLLAYGMLVVLLPGHSHGGSPDAYQIEVDDLADWGRTYGHSGTLALKESAGDDRDPTRIAGSGAEGKRSSTGRRARSDRSRSERTEGRTARLVR